MGNQLITDYDVDKEPIGNGGISGLWKIYKGVKKDTTKRVVSIFMLDKKIFGKVPKEELLAIVRKEAQTLARFRHPNVLSLVEPLKEDEKSMAFITEQVENSLANVLDQQGDGLKYYCPNDLELKYQIITLLDTLQFFHNDTKTAHLSLSPDNIYITPDGKWKVSGLVFAAQILSKELTDIPSINFYGGFGDAVKILPSLNFTAPELINSAGAKGSFSSDIFSFGCILYSVIKRNTRGGQNFLLDVNNVQGHNSAIQSAGRKIGDLPQPLQPLMHGMIAMDANSRPGLADIRRCPWLRDPHLQTIKHLESLIEKETPQQQSFLIGLSRLLNSFEKKQIMKNILPNLLNLFKIEALTPILIAILFRMLEQKLITNNEFSEKVWPELRSLTSGREIPAQALYLMVYKMPVLHELIPIADFNNVIITLFLKCLECSVAKLQELALVMTQDFVAKKLEYSTIKNKILPRLLMLLASENPANTPEIRKSTLICIKNIQSIIDKDSLQNLLLPALEKLRKLNNNSAINTLVLSIYDGLFKTLPVDILGNRVLGSLIPYLVDPNLNKREFAAYFTAVTNILMRIKEERLAAFANSYGRSEEDNMLEAISEEKLAASDITRDILKDAQATGTPGVPDFDFLSVFEREQTSPQQSHGQSTNLSGPSLNFGASGNDLFAGLNSTKPAQPKSNPGTQLNLPSFDLNTGPSSNDMFAGLGTSKPTTGFNAPAPVSAPKKEPTVSAGGGGGWGDFDLGAPIVTQQPVTKSLRPPTKAAPTATATVTTGGGLGGLSGLDFGSGTGGLATGTSGGGGLGGINFSSPGTSNGPTPKSTVGGGGIAKGNMAKLNYDPFAGIDSGDNAGLGGLGGGLGGMSGMGGGLGGGLGGTGTGGGWDSVDLGGMLNQTRNPVTGNIFAGAPPKQPAQQGGLNFDANALMFSNPTVSKNKPNQGGGGLI